MRWDDVTGFAEHPLVVALLIGIVGILMARLRNRIRVQKQIKQDLDLIKVALLGTPGHAEWGELPQKGLVKRFASLEEEFISDGNGSMRTLLETVAQGVANLEDGEEDFRGVWLHNVDQATDHGIKNLRRPKPFKPVVRGNIHFRRKE